MYSKKVKYWLYYPHNIIALNYKEEAFLLQYLSVIKKNSRYYESFEVIDIRKYRLIKKREQVVTIIQLPSFEQYFLFPVNKN